MFTIERTSRLKQRLHDSQKEQLRLVGENANLRKEAELHARQRSEWANLVNKLMFQNAAMRGEYDISPQEVKDHLETKLTVPKELRN